MAKAMHYVEENGKKYKIDGDGEKYRISWSEELQLKNLNALKRQVIWQRRNFYIKLALMVFVLICVAMFAFVLYRLDSVNFFSTIMYK